MGLVRQIDQTLQMKYFISLNKKTCNKDISGYSRPYSPKTAPVLTDKSARSIFLLI